MSDQGLHANLPIPDTVHGVLTARIDRLDEEAKRALQTASVLGRELTPRLLAAIWDGPGAAVSRGRRPRSPGRLERLADAAGAGHGRCGHSAVRVGILSSIRGAARAGWR